MIHLPAGTVTFLFTDIDWVDAIPSHYGYVIKTAGDDIHRVLEKATMKIIPLAIQRGLAVTHFVKIQHLSFTFT